MDLLSVEYEVLALSRGRALPAEEGLSDFFFPAVRAILGECSEVFLASLFTVCEFISKRHIRVCELTLVGEMTQVLNRLWSHEATARYVLPANFLAGSEVITSVSSEGLSEADRDGAELLPGLADFPVQRPLKSRYRFVSRGPRHLRTILRRLEPAGADYHRRAGLYGAGFNAPDPDSHYRPATGRYIRGHFLEALEQKLRVGRYLSHPVVRFGPGFVHRYPPQRHGRPHRRRGVLRRAATPLAWAWSPVGWRERSL